MLLSLFREIEGKRGENLASTILRYLLLQSPMFRDGFLSLVSASSGISPILTQSRFNCELEVTTRDPTSDYSHERQGRIDLCLETDSAVIGVENKFDAGFMPSQPFKYFSSLETRARAMSPDATVITLVVILAPERRRVEIENDIRKRIVLNSSAQRLDKFPMVSWDEVVDLLARTEKTEAPKLSVIMEEFREFIRQTVEFIPYLDSIFDDVVGPTEIDGSGLSPQRRFLEKLSTLRVPFSSRISATDRRLLSYSIDPRNVWTPSKNGWLALTSSKVIESFDTKPGRSLRGTELVIFLRTTSEFEPHASWIRCKTNERWSRSFTTWIIDFQPDWTGRAVWEQCLAPAFALLPLPT